MPIAVTLLLLPHCAATSAAIAQEVLHAANLFASAEPGAKKPFEVTIASLDGGDVPTSAGQTLRVDAPLAAITSTDLVIIPGFLFTLREAMPAFGRYGDWLRARHAEGATLASMCNAAFLLAQSGLLDGRRATTHWAFADLLRRRHPQVLLEPQQVICDDTRLVTNGGATAAMDLLLYLIAKFGSATLAHTCSRYLLIDPARSSQTPYALWTVPSAHGDQEIWQVQQWMAEHFDAPLAIDEVAQRFGFGARHFQRRFKEATGQPPLSYLQALRLDKARQLLETTRLPVEAITVKVGYGDSNSFRRLFQQKVGLTPSAYRRQFQPRVAGA